IPVLIGSVPRQDCQETYERYCRLMLTLFKPWRMAFDLHQPNESWSAAFRNYKSSPCCPNEFKELTDNMQLLHECKDDHDQH
ncbi:hypothetical protein L208DRAFT_1225942, partial [Tricholoma matsutake]